MVSELDDSVPHVLSAPWQPAFSGTWMGTCTCGEPFMAGTAQAVRDAGLPHRLAEIARLRNTPEAPTELPLSEVERRGPDVG